MSTSKGWIRHTDIECPVPPDTLVWLRFYCAERTSGQVVAGDYNWTPSGDNYQIAYYSTDAECPTPTLPEVGRGGSALGISQMLHPQPGMSEREFVQRYVIHLAPYAYGNSITDERCIKWARNAYRAIDEALKEEGE